MTYMTEVAQSTCVDCGETTFEARKSLGDDYFRCPDCGGEVR